MSSVLNIYQRINNVMKSVQYVQKDSSVSGMGGGYKAVSHDQVISVARQSLVDNGVIIFPNQIKGEFLQMRDVNATPTPIKMGLYSGTYEINFVNIDDGSDKITATIEAHANDNGDKAPGKALSYATKSAILKVLNLETGESDESREDQRDFNLISAEQVDQLFPLLCDSNGQYTEKGSKVCRAFKFNNLNEIKSKKFNEILRFAS
ncbi:MAG TPA: hypothetical protein EYN67_16895 [Flavobacteriales bacterium]|nr:hypothetical protein [Methylococcaceae bacterium]HHZ97179.1 hypothetical protein [Flavobacteriales bacterium]